MESQSPKLRSIIRERQVSSKLNPSRGNTSHIIGGTKKRLETVADACNELRDTSPMMPNFRQNIDNVKSFLRREGRKDETARTIRAMTKEGRIPPAVRLQLLQAISGNEEGALLLFTELLLRPINI